MHSTHSNTAILLFSRSAAGESMAKPLISRGQNKQQQAIAAQFIRHARRVAAASGLPIFFVSEHQQHGFTFGERFSDAFQQIFERGFERVIAIGNDCPTLTASDLLAAAQKMDIASAVFGPATDGGTYLVGLRRDVFKPVAFSRLDWQTDHTLAHLQAYVGNDFCCLSEKSDVDSATDLQQQLRSRFFPVFLKFRLLNLLILTLPSRFDSLVFAPQAALLSGLALRGPPR